MLGYMPRTFTQITHRWTRPISPSPSPLHCFLPRNRKPLPLTLMMEVQHSLETSSQQNLGLTFCALGRRHIIASNLQSAWGVGQLSVCLQPSSQTQTRSELVFAQCSLHLPAPPPPRAEDQVLNHTAYQRLCITNTCSNHTLYYRTCTTAENRCHHENHIFCYFPILACGHL